MASSGGAGAGEQPAVAMDARLLMATGREDCERLKDLVNKKDATKMVVVLVSSKEPPAEPTAPPPAMNPLLLASACAGSWMAMKSFLMEDPTMLMTRKEFQDLVMSSDDGVVPAAASLLLQGVTVDGDTALHVVASHGDGDGFLECAGNIHNISADLVLFKQNRRGDTPLHCAARAGKSQMVGCLLGLARGVGQQQFVRTENAHHETALHDAVRRGNKEIVEKLMAADPELARFPEDGVSPLYLAVLLEYGSIAETLYDSSKGNLSYSGPHGQNALHAAVLRGTVFTKLLTWNKDLTAQVDEKGSTPLHFAAALNDVGIAFSRSVCKQLLDANIGALYQPDKDGLFPIHVAASLGASEIVNIFLRMSPGSAGLRDAMGWTFLHVAVEKLQLPIVSRACINRSLTWILNMQDNHGDTALHLAVQTGRLRIFYALLGNQHVQLNLANHKGQTPLDLSLYNRPPGFSYTRNTEVMIQQVLQMAGGKHGGCRTDHIIKHYKIIMHQQKLDVKSKELEKLRDSTQSLCIGAVLIATVTFGATFALPGGYKADDHPNGGTPTLAGRYAFDAFMMANTIAFVCSSIATVGFMFSGSPMVNLRIRKIYTVISIYFMRNSVICLSATFALGAYMVLAPVAHKTAIAICVIGPLVVLFSIAEFWIKQALLTPSLLVRRGVIWTLRRWTWSLMGNMLLNFWSLIFIFAWAAHARD